MKSHQVVAALALCVAGSHSAAPAVAQSDHIEMFDVPIVMSDGVRLSADVYLPATGGAHRHVLNPTSWMSSA